MAATAYYADTYDQAYTDMPRVLNPQVEIETFYAKYTFTAAEDASSADTIALFKVPGDTCIFAGGIRWTGAETATTIDLGYANNVDCLLDGTTLAAADSFSFFQGGTNDKGWPMSTSEATCIATLGGSTEDPDAGDILEVWALGMRAATTA